MFLEKEPQAFIQLPFSNVNTPAWEQDGGFRASAELARRLLSPWCSQMREDQTTSISLVLTGIVWGQVIDSRMLELEGTLVLMSSVFSRLA